MGTIVKNTDLEKLKSVCEKHRIELPTDRVITAWADEDAGRDYTTCWILHLFTEDECFFSKRIDGESIFKRKNDKVFTFGKYKGARLGDVKRIDKQYVDWCTANLEFFKRGGGLIHKK